MRKRARKDWVGSDDSEEESPSVDASQKTTEYPRWAANEPAGAAAAPRWKWSRRPPAIGVAISW